MRAQIRLIASTVLAASFVTALALPASAACTRLGFSVNDYGKDGPTKDAKSLLDGYVAKWAKDRGISKYQTGKKDVNCELFLNFIVFDEHTCRAEATVCWDGAPLPKSQSADGGAAPSRAAAPGGRLMTKRASLTAVKPAAATIETGALPAPAAVAPTAPKPAAAPAPVAATPAPAAPAKANTATADQALAAAEKAAAAAERAAAAAERAAAAAARVEGAPAAAKAVAKP